MSESAAISNGDLEAKIALYMQEIARPGLSPDAARLRRKSRKLELQRARRARMNRVDYHDASDRAIQIMSKARGILKAYTDSGILNAILEDWARCRHVFRQDHATDVRR